MLGPLGIEDGKSISSDLSRFVFSLDGPEEERKQIDFDSVRHESRKDGKMTPIESLPSAIFVLFDGTAPSLSKFRTKGKEKKKKVEEEVGKRIVQNSLFQSLAIVIIKIADSLPHEIELCIDW